MNQIRPSARLSRVSYDIRGELDQRADALRQEGAELIELNIGNPGRFELGAPKHLQSAVSENLSDAEAYCHQQGIVPAREAIADWQGRRGVAGVDAEQVFIGNGVSELIDIFLRALLEPGDEVLLPAPDYPLWTASTVLNGGEPVYYRCGAERRHLPDPDEVAAAITGRTRALVLINPNNPTGAVYDRDTLVRLAAIAAEHDLLLFSDEIYDQILYEDVDFVPAASVAHGAVCISFSGLSKVWRACGYRVGWAVVSGQVERAGDYLQAVDTLLSLRLCSNVPGQWAIQPALAAEPCIRELVSRGGRLERSREAVIEACAESRWLSLIAPMGALYAFPRVKTGGLPEFDDYRFALELLTEEQILVVPGSSFNFDRRDHFRITFLPRPQLMRDAVQRIDRHLDRRSRQQSATLSWPRPIGPPPGLNRTAPPIRAGTSSDRSPA